MQVTLLGTGTSCGVPMIGCTCEVCTSNDPRDKRLRCSALIETEHTRVLIDCGPDFRQQILQQPFRKIDGILLTHIHYDHVGGLDDLRPYCDFGDINIYAERQVIDSLHHTMPYVFAEKKYPGVPELRMNEIVAHQLLTIGDIQVMPIRVMHGKLPILGYRFGAFTYITDMKSIDESEYTYLAGTKILVVNALRFKDAHHSHQLVDDAIVFARRLGAEHTYLIHSSHHIGKHEEVNKILPKSFEMAFDGQKISI